MNDIPFLIKILKSVFSFLIEGNSLKSVFIKDLEGLKGREVTISGWVHRVRALGKLAFIVLRDATGLVQVVIKENPELLKKARELNLEDTIRVVGVITESKSKVSSVEIHAKDLVILNKAIEVLPLDVTGVVDADLGVRLRYRVVDLKKPKNLAIFKIQGELVDAFRRYLRSQGFIEIHTPKIVASSTEGGAEVFELQYFERKAYLAQSPQLYKQLMVIAGFERVFEVGPVFRAEKHNTSRHLNEYLSLDVEMGFIDNERDVMNLEEKLIRNMFLSVEENCKRELNLLNVTVPEFERIPVFTFKEAQEILVEYFNLKEYENVDDLDQRGEELICKYAMENFEVELVFIDLFPLSSRPFYTMPYDKTYGRSFDLLFRGLEVSTGSQRIHKYSLLFKRLKDKGLDPENFKYYLEAFRYGAPPHGGFAIGAERLTMKLLGLKNIREAVLFPRDRFRVEP